MRAQTASEDLVALTKTMAWIQDFIMKPHLKQRRMNAVCPFVKPAIDSDVFYLTVAHPENPNSDKDLYQEMRRYRDIF